MVSCTWHWLQDFMHLAPVARFPAIGTDCTVSCTWRRLHGSLDLTPVVRFHILGTGCIISCTWHQLQDFIHLASAAYSLLLLTFADYFVVGLVSLQTSSELSIFTCLSMRHNSFLHGYIANPHEEHSQLACLVQVVRPLHWYRRGHGFESCKSLNVFFRLYFHNCLSCVHNWDDNWHDRLLVF